MIVENARNFDRPFLLLCEGQGDIAFFNKFFEVHNLGNDFRIRYPEKAGIGGYKGGRECFGKDLVQVSTNEDFLQNVKAILIVADCDEDRAESLKKVQDEIRLAKSLPIPDAEKTLAKLANFPGVVILLVPLVGNGNLEKLCLQSAYHKWGFKEHLDRYVQATPANDWSDGKQSKMRMHSLLAATNRKRPDMGFATHFSAEIEYQIPLDHECFDSLVEFFRTEFPQIVAA